jgi:hypothetical protein
MRIERLIFLFFTLLQLVPNVFANSEWDLKANIIEYWQQGRFNAQKESGLMSGVGLGMSLPWRGWTWSSIAQIVEGKRNLATTGTAFSNHFQYEWSAVIAPVESSMDSAFYFGIGLNHLNVSYYLSEDQDVDQVQQKIYYLPIGYQLWKTTSTGWNVGLKVEYDFLLKGTNYDGYHTTRTLSKNVALKLQLDFLHATEWGYFSIQPYWNYWSIHSAINMDSSIRVLQDRFHILGLKVAFSL